MRKGLIYSLILIMTIIYGVSAGLTFAETNSNNNTPKSNLWTVCSVEGGSCNFEGTKMVRYGLNGKYVYRMVTGFVACNNFVFGDPIFGSVKNCEVSQADLAWVKCSNEFETCQFQGPRMVRYGIDGRFVYNSFTSNVGCNNGVFGDPYFGKLKSCWYSEELVGSSFSWEKCATQNSVCTFSGTKIVRYGAKGNFHYMKTSNSITCDNKTFGNPLIGTLKSCEYLK
jgi:hypothetical protein